MTQRPEIVFNGYLTLTASEKTELINAINEYVESDSDKKSLTCKTANAHIVKMDIGPMGGSCPCCGR